MQICERDYSGCPGSPNSQMLGTLIHEIIHVLTGDTDAQMAKILGVSITSQDTSAISKAIGSQCFQ